MHNLSICPKIGEVYLIKFEGKGSVQSGLRPGVVIQNNIGNEHSPNIIAVPLTSSIKNLSQPTHVYISAEEAGLKLDSMVLCENPETISKEMVGKKIAVLSDENMARIAKAIMLSIPIISYLNLEEVRNVWSEASTLGAC